MAVPVASVTVAASPDDESGQTMRFAVTGAPGALTWRFGDLTDEGQSDPSKPIDHAFSAPGEFAALAHVGATGQIIEVPVSIAGTDPSPPDPEPGPALTVTGCTPSTAPVETLTSLVIVGTGFAKEGTGPPQFPDNCASIATDLMGSNTRFLENAVVVNDTTITCNTPDDLNVPLPMYVSVWLRSAPMATSATPLLTVTTP